jgi:hypothetical protein
MPCLCLRNRRERGSCRVTSKSVYRLDPLIRTESQVASHARPPSTVTRLISHKFTSAPAQRTWSSLISGTSQSPPPAVSVSSHAQASYNKPAIQHQRSPSSVDVPPQPSKKPELSCTSFSLLGPPFVRSSQSSRPLLLGCLSVPISLSLLDRLLLELYSLPPCTHEFAGC